MDRRFVPEDAGLRMIETADGIASVVEQLNQRLRQLEQRIFALESCTKQIALLQYHDSPWRTDDTAEAVAQSENKRSLPKTKSPTQAIRVDGAPSLILLSSV